LDDLGNCLGYTINTCLYGNADKYVRIHANPIPISGKHSLEHCYDPMWVFKAPNIHKMNFKYQCLHQIPCQTLAIKVGQRGMARSYLVDSLNKIEKIEKFDIMEYIYNEIHICTIKKKSCVYAPYLQALIETKLPKDFAWDNYPKRAHAKLTLPLPSDKIDQSNPKESSMEVESDGEGTSSMVSKDPLWRKAMHKLFCLGQAQLDNNHKTRESNKELIKLMKAERCARGIDDDLARVGAEEVPSPKEKFDYSFLGNSDGENEEEHEDEEYGDE
jgi:hypothetical protein